MKTDLSTHVAEIARRILGPENKERSSRTELRFGTHGSVSVVIAGPDAGKWYDHENDIGGGPVELILQKAGIAADEVGEWFKREFGIDIGGTERRGAKRPIAATYDYCGENGALLFQVVRYADPKDFRQRRPDGRGDWIWSTTGIRPVPYRLPELLAAPAEAPVFIVEGEKDADRLIAEGLVATCNAGGAAKRPKTNKPGGAAKWRPGLNQFFRGRDVVVLPDNDDAGRDHARAVIENLLPVARSVRLIELPGLQPKGDVSDWLDGRGTAEQLLALVKASAPLRADDLPRDRVSDEAELSQAAKMPMLQYERERAAIAARLGVRASMLDVMVKALRAQDSSQPGSGRPVELQEHEPWPEPVNGSDLLSDIVVAIRQHIVLGDAEADAVALWAVASHSFDSFYIFPRLVVNAPEKECGKTTLLEVIGCLVQRKLTTESITPAATYRTIEAYRPTMLLDEVDTYLPNNEEMRGVVDSGHKRDGAVIRVVGDNNEPRQFSTWAPMVLSGIGRLAGTIEGRAVNITLKRRRSDEPIQSFRPDRPNGFGNLARKAARWVSDQAAALADVDPAMPAAVINRAADNWRPLLAVADLAGGQWPDRARTAASKLIGAKDDQSRAVMLFADIKAAFEATRVDRISSADLVAYLVSLDDRPWPEFKSGKPLSPAQLARTVKKFGVSSGNVRLDDGRTPKGYHRKQFDDAFARYLPAQNATPPQAADFQASRPESKAPQAKGCGVSESAGTLSVSAACGGVAFSEPLSRANDVEIEERAAILEYEAGLSREEADRLAGLNARRGPAQFGNGSSVTETC